MYIERSSMGRRHVLSLPGLLMTLLMVLFSVFRVAGQSAMPDVVCFGATKHYWVDPNPVPGSTYTWQIDGVVQPLLTTSDISITWDATYALGNHTISVQEKSVSGCFGEVKTGLVTVNPVLPVTVLVAAAQNPACSGLPVAFIATATNGGTSPVYKWTVNGVTVGPNANTYTYVPAAGDMVVCEVTSDAACATNNPAVSTPVTMQLSDPPLVTFVPCFDLITSVEAKPFKLRGGLPLNGSYSGSGVNPATGVFTPAVAGAGTIPVTYTYVNSAGCSGSAVVNIQNNPAQTTFVCGSDWIDIRDNNKSYQTIQIVTPTATQCWMAENLDYGLRIQSTQLQSDNCVNEKYCYNNDPANCTGAGALYQWDELMTYDNTPASQGICPPGWHVPDEPEWTVLLDFYGGNARAGNPLQKMSATGFNALPGGVLYLNNAWSFRDLATLFWTSTPVGPVNVISHGMNTVDPSVSYYESARTNAFPVRCLKN